MYNLENKTAIITGGSNGIGRATANLLASYGANIAIFDIDEKGANEVASEILEKHKKAKVYVVDTSKMESVEKATKQVFDDFGSIEILINNAGITRDASMKKMTTDQWQQVIDVNLTGVFNCTKCAFPYMADKNYGRIISASSVVAHYGNFGQTNYVAAKAGIIGMTKVWAREFGRKGITVNAIAPGFINTDMMKTVPQDYLKSLEEKTPLVRLGEVEDIANAYAFLASDKASYITGTTLKVDGGLVL
jgi:3-oxoacyl-[acyl-carrier protein] reductase